ncbi:Dot/Icm secretion system protein IcmQ [Legionella sp. W05-934-2]|jgi:intracellular multiplication protein IcmQ|uniref:Dot/Icm secretion system protein IcmQ n=1 Tax=Legionella sp. W05-934-2 TaxID=1198649 RepID=UPI0034625CDB
MKEDKLTRDQIQSIRNAFDKALNEGPWQETNFLRAMGKQLEKIRDNFLVEVGEKSSDAAETSSNLANRVALRSGQQEIYISLYSSSGNQLSSWEKVIANLPRQLISRPIYEDEERVRSRIKSKSMPVNEAYVCAYIDKDDIKILPKDKIPHDKLNHPLLTVKDRAITLDDITRFVHLSGTYQYREGRLVKNANSASNDEPQSE